MRVACDSPGQDFARELINLSKQNQTFIFPLSGHQQTALDIQQITLPINVRDFQKKQVLFHIHDNKTIFYNINVYDKERGFLKK